jgi:hypothetical protein
MDEKIRLENEERLKKLVVKEKPKNIRTYRNFNDVFAALNFTKGNALT